MELIEEDELALALKASVETALEERAAQAAIIHFDDVSGNFEFFSYFAVKVHLALISLYFFIGSQILGEPSRTGEIIFEEMVELQVPIAEAVAPEKGIASIVEAES